MGRYVAGTQGSSGKTEAPLRGIYILHEEAGTATKPGGT